MFSFKIENKRKYNLISSDNNYLTGRCYVLFERRLICTRIRCSNIRLRYLQNNNYIHVVFLYEY